MNYIKHLRGFFDRIECDERITAHHISLYMAVFHTWNLNRFRKQFETNRMDLMAMSRIGSRNTYSKCMKQLNDWGYIHYFPGSNRYQVTKISCIRFDTSGDTSRKTPTDTTNDTSSGTLLLNSSNNSNGKTHPKIVENGKQKKSRGENRLHVKTDKDYSEPL